MSMRPEPYSSPMLASFSSSSIKNCSHLYDTSTSRLAPRRRCSSNVAPPPENANLWYVHQRVRTNSAEHSCNSCQFLALFLDTFMTDICCGNKKHMVRVLIEKPSCRCSESAVLFPTQFSLTSHGSNCITTGQT